MVVCAMQEQSEREGELGAERGIPRNSLSLACPLGKRRQQTWPCCMHYAHTYCVVALMKHPDGSLFRTILVTEGRERVVCRLQRLSFCTVAGRRWKMAPAFGQHFKGLHPPIHAGP